MTVHTGGCACGDIRIEAAGEPLMVGECHCGQCQKNCGGSGASLTIYPKDAVRITKGSLRFYATTADSGNNVNRGFCQNCGTPVMSTLDRSDEIVVVKLGALDDPSVFTPQVVFWTSEAHAWTKFPDGTVQHEANPPE